jgi:hypothetical protein
VATFQEHLQQAKRNLNFLSNIHRNVPDSIDWQVTTCFYSALHLLNAYLAQEADLHYISHKETEHALNFENKLSVVKLSENDFLTYQKLRNLSRRSRYLCTEYGVTAKGVQLTGEKQLANSVICLDKLMRFFVTKYPTTVFDKITLKCPTLLGEQMQYFEIEKLREIA